MTSNPLDALVISQLAAIRQHEASLQHQIRKNSDLNVVVAEAQLLALQQRADRLNRMIDAMSISSVYSQLPFEAPVAA
ncbi:MAG TPA: hypothetical protein VH351_12275 [Bryobacteraceae bacterium]|jgi:hypothetical protein|nr:hypothetical protein [Bryobacteraceae bacterium]